MGSSNLQAGRTTLFAGNILLATKTRDVYMRPGALNVPGPAFAGRQALVLPWQCHNRWSIPGHSVLCLSWLSRGEHSQRLEERGFQSRQAAVQSNVGTSHMGVGGEWGRVPAPPSEEKNKTTNSLLFFFFLFFTSNECRFTWTTPMAQVLIFN